MIISDFGTRTAIAVTTAPALIDYSLCGAQGLWCASPSTNSQNVCFAIASSTADASLIGELAPGESSVINVRSSATDISLYVYTRSSTATVSVGGVK